MSEGKFSQPRPHRDEERLIEESFRQLTEDKKRRRKTVYNVEEDIQNTVQEKRLIIAYSNSYHTVTTCQNVYIFIITFFAQKKH